MKRNYQHRRARLLASLRQLLHRRGATLLCINTRDPFAATLFARLADGRPVFCVLMDRHDDLLRERVEWSRNHAVIHRGVAILGVRRREAKFWRAEFQGQAGVEVIEL